MVAIQSSIAWWSSRGNLCIPLGQQLAWVSCPLCSVVSLVSADDVCPWHWMHSYLSSQGTDNTACTRSSDNPFSQWSMWESNPSGVGCLNKQTMQRLLWTDISPSSRSGLQVAWLLLWCSPLLPGFQPFKVQPQQSFGILSNLLSCMVRGPGRHSLPCQPQPNDQQALFRGPKKILEKNQQGTIKRMSIVFGLLGQLD